MQLLPNPTLAGGRYEIGEELLLCRFSSLYRGTDHTTRTPVVLRQLVLPPGVNAELMAQLKSQFIREAQLLRRLAHRNLPRVLDVLQEGDSVLTVLEPFEGHHLEYVIDHMSVRPSQKLLANWMDQVAAALEYLHTQDPPIVYRDLTPHSVIVTPHAVIKLVDFGLAKMVDHVGQVTVLHGQGPQNFAAPEQLAGQGRSEPRTDLYALGATFYRLASGAFPPAWERIYDQTPVTSIQISNPALTDEFCSLVERLMAIKLDDRPATAHAVRAMLAPLLAPPALEPPSAAPPAAVTPAAAPPVGVSPWDFLRRLAGRGKPQPRREAGLGEVADEHYPLVDLSTLQLERDIGLLLPEALAQRIGGVCIARQGKAITLAVKQPEVYIYDHVEYTTHGQYKAILMRADAASIDLALEYIYRRSPRAESVTWLEWMEKKKFHGMDLSIIQTEEQERLLQAEDVRGPAVEMVDRMIKEAISVHASDIHIETYEREVVLRYRIDGILHTMDTWPRSQAGAYIKRVKILGNMDIAQELLPQGGRISVRVSDPEFDLRVSCVPVADGESIVMRLLNKGTFDMKLQDLGFGERNIDIFRRLIEQPHGMVLVSGPTGSGKSTTLYAALAEINRPDRKILTVEDPIEYKMQGVVQVQVNMAPREDEKRLTFAKALREFLRHDPDVILVGEIRDDETAAISVQAALTGHLVLSTIHTNDAVGIITRLRDRGIETFLLSTTLIGGIAQRLVRRICSGCKAEIAVPHAMLEAFAQEGITIPHMFAGRGCLQCHQTGYRGRVAMYEILEVTEELRDLIASNANAGQLLRCAQQAGMKTLYQDGLLKVDAGQVTLEEVKRVCMSL